MRFWLGVGIAECFEGGRGRSVRVEGASFPSFHCAIKRLAIDIA